MTSQNRGNDLILQEDGWYFLILQKGDLMFQKDCICQKGAWYLRCIAKTYLIWLQNLIFAVFLFSKSKGHCLVSGIDAPEDWVLKERQASSAAGKGLNPHVQLNSCLVCRSLDRCLNLIHIHSLLSSRYLCPNMGYIGALLRWQVHARGRRYSYTRGIVCYWLSYVDDVYALKEGIFRRMKRPILYWVVVLRRSYTKVK